MTITLKFLFYWLSMHPRIHSKKFLCVKMFVLLHCTLLFCGYCFCHTRLQLGFLAKLRILQVPACKMEPQSGIIIVRNQLSGRPADHPTTSVIEVLYLSFFFQCCAVFPPQLMCGVPSSQYRFLDVYASQGSTLSLTQSVSH